MHARWHRRFAQITLFASALLLFTGSEGVARSTNGVWRLIDDGTNLNDDPGSRKHSTLIYDAGMNRLIMFGGDKSPSGAYSDVWAFPLPCGPWVELFDDDATDCSSTSRPCRRHGHTAVYVPGSSPMMLVHGGKGEDGCLINDTWKLTLGASPGWTRVWVPGGGSVPLPRWHHAMVYRGSPIFGHGGVHSGCNTSVGIGMCDVWTFNTTNNTWAGSGNKTASGSCEAGGSPPHIETPDRRYAHSMIVDTGNNRIVTFGGAYEGESVPSDVWYGTPWTLIGNVPDSYSRTFHTASYDPLGARMIVIGGYEDISNLSTIVSAVTSMSTSLSTYGTWSTLSPTGTGPGLISEHAAVYDPVGDRILVYGGVDQNGTFRSGLWALDFGSSDMTPPSTVSSLVVTGVTSNSATIRWNAPGDDGTTGTACRYDIRYSQSPITNDATFAAAAAHTNAPTPAMAGTAQSTTVGGLTTGLQYFAMKAIDESGNTSALSNVVLTCIPDVTSPDVTPPSAVSNLAFTGVTPNSATIRWTAPGDDGTACTAASYNIRYSVSPITDDATFAAATAHTGAPSPAMAGTLQSTTIGGLTSGLTYYFAMKTVDDHSNVSALSNVIFVCIPYIPNTLCDESIQLPEGENRVESSFGIKDLGPQLASSPLQFSFGLSRSGPVTIEMFDVTDRRVARTDLADLAPGEYTRSLSTGSRLAAGIYVVRLQQGSSATTRRVVLLQQ